MKIKFPNMLIRKYVFMKRNLTSRLENELQATKITNHTRVVILELKKDNMYE